MSNYIYVRIPFQDAGYVNDILKRMKVENSDEIEVICNLITSIDREIGRIWDPSFNQETLCKCGHPYYRHYDTYDDMAPVGCKYCECDTFEGK